MFWLGRFVASLPSLSLKAITFSLFYCWQMNVTLSARPTQSQLIRYEHKTISVWPPLIRARHSAHYHMKILWISRIHYAYITLDSNNNLLRVNNTIYFGRWFFSLQRGMALLRLTSIAPRPVPPHSDRVRKAAGGTSHPPTVSSHLRWCECSFIFCDEWRTLPTIFCSVNHIFQRKPYLVL